MFKLTFLYSRKKYISLVFFIKKLNHKIKKTLKTQQYYTKCLKNLNPCFLVPWPLALALVVAPTNPLVLPAAVLVATSHPRLPQRPQRPQPPPQPQPRPPQRRRQLPSIITRLCVVEFFFYIQNTKLHIFNT